MDLTIFRPYDIRGKYPEEINGEVAEEITFKFASFLKNKAKEDDKFIIGMDVRHSSPEIYNAIIVGLERNGVDKDRIIKAGVITTPMLYFLSAYFDAAGGFMVTSSHNPPTTNGIKIVGKNVAFISGEDIKKIIF